MGRESVKQQGRGLQGCCLYVAHEHPCTLSAIPTVSSPELKKAAQSSPQQPFLLGERQSKQRQAETPFPPCPGEQTQLTAGAE